VVAGIAAIGGLLAGILLWMLTTALSRSQIAGNGWSLSGNGALVVPFGIAPAIVAAGWTAIVLRMRAHPRWKSLGIASGLVGLFLLGASLLSLVVFGAKGREAGASASVLFGFFLYGWLIISAILAAVIPAPDAPTGRWPIWSLLALLLLPLAMIAGCEAGTQVIPS
jgi:hypothetical protein